MDDHGLNKASSGTALSLIDRPGPTWRLVFSLAWPVLLQYGLVLSVQLSDRLLAGRFQTVDDAANVASQNAQTTGSYFSWVITNYTILISVGSTALVARCVGAGERKEAVAVTHQALLIAIVLGLLGSAVGLPLLPALMDLLQLPVDATGFAVAYLRPLFWLLTFQMIESAGIACLIGAGDTRTGLAVLGGVAVDERTVGLVRILSRTSITPPGLGFSWNCLPAPRGQVTCLAVCPVSRGCCGTGERAYGCKLSPGLAALGICWTIGCYA